LEELDEGSLLGWAGEYLRSGDEVSPLLLAMVVVGVLWYEDWTRDPEALLDN
jgi:hypothetical protein